MGQDPNAIRQEIEQTRARMGDTIDALGYKADVPARTKESIAGTYTSVKDKLIGRGEQLSDAAADLGDRAPGREDVRRAGRQAVGVAQENPLGLAIGAAAVGFLAGMLIPSSSVEDRRLGPASEEVKLRARQTGEDAIEHGRQIAQETGEVVAEKAQELADEVKDAAQDTAAHAQDAAGEIKETAQDSAHEHAEDLGADAREHAGELGGPTPS